MAIVPVVDLSNPVLDRRLEAFGTFRREIACCPILRTYSHSSPIDVGISLNVQEYSMRRGNDYIWSRLGRSCKYRHICSRIP